MISSLELNKIIVAKIRAILKGSSFSTVPIISYDVSEGFQRPSIKVDFDNSTLENLNANMLNKNLTVRIYFFATDIKKFKIENLKILNLLEEGFIEGIETEIGFIEIFDVNSNVIDTVLEVNFDIDINSIKVDKTDTEAEFMEDLELNLK